MDFLDQAALVEELQIAPDGHIRDAERTHQIGYPYGTLLAHALKNQSLPLAGQSRPLGPHVQSLRLVRHSFHWLVTYLSGNWHDKSAPGRSSIVPQPTAKVNVFHHNPTLSVVTP
jgi:hypothetical protein